MPMLCIHISQSLIFEAVLLVASKVGQKHVEAASARQVSVGSASGHWELSWGALCSAVSSMLVLKVSERQSRLV